MVEIPRKKKDSLKEILDKSQKQILIDSGKSWRNFEKELREVSVKKLLRVLRDFSKELLQESKKDSKNSVIFSDCSQLYRESYI